MATHTILDGKVRLYQRSNSTKWHCAARMHGKNIRRSTGESELASAKKAATEWFFTLRAEGQNPSMVKDTAPPLVATEKTFKDAAEKFLAEYPILTKGQRNARYVTDHGSRLHNHLVPYFGNKSLSEITAGLLQSYRVMRMSPKKGKKLPSRSTLNHEDVTFRQVMKTALRHGWIQHLLDFSAPYKTSSKVTHRGWFSHEEYKTLYQATRANAQRQHQSPRRQYEAEQLHDKVLFMANTGLRPDEINNLTYGDVEFIEENNEEILLIQVQGKRGLGYCKSTKGAVFPFERLLRRNQPKAQDKVFPQDHKKLLNRILEENDLKFDKHGNRRTFYSLRHSYISFRLLEGANIYQVAKNCRTSVQMIQKHYAVHLKNNIDAAAINVSSRKPGKNQQTRLEALNRHRASE